jgi:hypothetical protein
MPPQRVKALMEYYYYYYRLNAEILGNLMCLAQRYYYPRLYCTLYHANTSRESME